MKHALLILLAVSIFSCSPWKKVSTDPSYSLIIDAPGISKDELFVDINRWFAYEFNSSESVINYQDKEAGIISGRFSSPYEAAGYKNDGLSDIESEVRDERFKITFEARESRTYGLKSLYLLNNAPPPSGWSSIRWQHDLDAIMAQDDPIVDHLVEYLNKEEENW